MDIAEPIAPAKSPLLNESHDFFTPSFITPIASENWFISRMKPLSVSLPIESIRLDTDAIICCMAFMALYMLVMIKSIRFTVCKAFCAAAIIPLPVSTASCPLLYLDSASDLALKAALAASSSPFFIASSYALEAFSMSAIACCISFMPAIIFDFPAS